ncbi:hypothetical protein CTheo_6966 [Ceratobasidium theobromae]|uniref:GAR domain-containing protein n=1 Tax=Ceratobasidium theobromae TaxID=1582974 RepID=A0A5N5QDS5_9AGAM|nr:hypothetical protein CTheo_6966 [Ceratobasidium theobromae]
MGWHPHSQVQTVENTETPCAMGSDTGSDVDMEDVTVTRPLPVKEDDDPPDEDTPMELSLLAVSTRITELAYTVSDIQTQLFEIQELRHADDSNNSGETHLAIERAMTELKQAMTSVDVEFEEIHTVLAPALEAVKTLPNSDADQMSEHEPVLRKHAALLAEWNAVNQEVSRLHNELQEDQLLVRFRTAVDQAAGMMDSLDKAVEACQEFIWRKSKSLRAGPNDPNGKASDVWSHFAETVDHYERIKKYYLQSSTQAMASIDKTMGSRDFKNGEVLRRHTELSARWKSIRERISRTDREIEALKRPPDPDPSESGSVRSRTTTSSRPESQSTSMSTSESLSVSTLSHSISPLRKLAARVTSGFKTPNKNKEKDKDKSKSKSTPVPILTMPLPRIMSPTHPKVTSPPPTRITAQSIFSNPSFGASSTNVSTKGSSSAPPKPRWNASTKVENEVKASPPHIGPPRPIGAGHARRASASGRQSVMSGRQTPSSRPQWPGGPRPETPNSGPRKRPTSPSQIPAPIDVDIGPPSIHKTFATPMLPNRQGGPPPPPPPNDSPEQMFLTPPKARRASQSRIPAPVFRPSRPASPSASTTSYFPDGSTSPSAMSTQFMSALASPVGSTGRSPFFDFIQGTSRPSPRTARAPPSSYRGTTPMPSSGRPSSRASANGETSGRRTSLDRLAAMGQDVDLTYTPNPKDGLDVELARVANSLAHPYLIERVSEYVKGAQGPDASAQYAFTNALGTGRKVLTCKLVIVEKSAGRSSIDGASPAGQQRRVICRVGGGWESLSAFLARSV